MIRVRYLAIVLLMAAVVVAIVVARQPGIEQPATPAGASPGASPLTGRGDEPSGIPGDARQGPVSRPVVPLESPAISLQGTWRLWLPSQGTTDVEPFAVEHVRKVVGLPLDDEAVMSIRIPGTLQEALADAGVLPSRLGWSDEGSDLWGKQKEWWLYYQGLIIPDQWRGRAVRLELDDVRGELDAWLNGQKLTRTEGGTEAAFDVPDIFSVRAEGDGEAAANWLALRLRPATQDSDDGHIVPMGILGTARLRSYRGCSVDRVSVQIKSLSRERAILQVDSLLRNSTRQVMTVALIVSVHPADQSREAVTTAIPVAMDAQSTMPVTATCHLDYPDLWWPHGLGTRHFYEVRAIVSADEHELSSAEVMTAIREIAPASAASDDQSCESRLLANGRQPVEVRGSVWTSTKGFIQPDYEKLVSLAASSGLNTFYVVGPETWRFYEVCDRRGMMVFQEVPVQLPTDPSESSLPAISAARETVRRLMSHPCVIAWCIGEADSGGVLDERIREAVSQFQRDVDPSRPFIAVHDDHSPLVMWTASPRTEDATTVWGRTCIQRVGLGRALCGEEFLKALLPSTDLWPGEPTTPAVEAALEAANRYGKSSTLTAHVAKSRLDQGLAFERQVTELAHASHGSAGLIVGEFNRPRPDVTAGLAQWDGTPMPSLQRLRRYWQGVSIFADVQSDSGPALVTSRGEILAADVYVLSHGASDYSSLIATAKLTTPSNELVGKDAVRIDLPAGALQWVMQFQAQIPSECTDELLFLTFSLRDSEGQMLASSTQWIGVPPSTEAEKALDVVVVTDDTAEGAERWGFLEKHGIGLTLFQAPAPYTPPQPTGDVVPGEDWDQPDTQRSFREGDQQDWGDGTTPGGQDDATGDGTNGNGNGGNGEDDATGEETMDDAIETPVTAQPEAQALPEADVIIFDAQSCAEQTQSEIVSRVKAGNGLLLARMPSDTWSSSIVPLVPLDVLSEAALDFGSGPAPSEGMAHHPVVADVDLARVAASEGFYKYAPKADAIVVAHRGKDRPMMIETQWEDGRVVVFTRNVALPSNASSQDFRWMIINSVGYLGNLPFPKIVGLRQPPSRAAYRGMGELGEGALEVVTRATSTGGVSGSLGSPPGRGPTSTGSSRAQVQATVVNTSDVPVLLCELGLSRTEAALLSEGDIWDWPGFCGKLYAERERKGTPAARIWGLLPADAQQALEAIAKGTEAGGEGRRSALAALNALLKRLELYERESFAGVYVPLEGEELLTRLLEKEGASDEEVLRLNRLLMEAAFPQQLEKSQGLPDSITMQASDNYLNLAPGETRSVTLTFESDLPPDQPKYRARLRIKALNVPERSVPFVVRFKPPFGPSPPIVEKTVASGSRIPQWSRFELSARVRATYANPFRDVTVIAELTSPAQRTKSVRGFYDGEGIWRVRFAPDETGLWQYRLIVRDEAGEDQDEGTFTCTSPRHGGFVGISSDNPTRLALTDGSPFVVIGGGCFAPWEPWATGGKSFEHYLELHQAHGMNALRVFLYQEFHRGKARDAMVNLLAEGALDRFDVALCRRFDEFMTAAANRGVHASIALFDHWPVKNDWDRYAYAAGNGGACLTQQELFTSPQAFEQQKFFIDYVVARWGAFSNVMAWEIWNEIDLVSADALTKDGPAMKWHRELVEHIRSVDAHQHLIFTSFSSGTTPEDWYLEPWNQMMSYHHYAAYCGGIESSIDDDLYQTFVGLRHIRKPLLLGELGFDKLCNDKRPAKQEYLRVGAWSMLFMGGGIILWDDNDFRITDETRANMKRLRSLFDQNRLAELDALGSPLKALSHKEIYGWLLSSPAGDRYALYVHNFDNHTTNIAGASIPTPIKGRGQYKIRWEDPKSGDVVIEEERRLQGGLVIVNVPDFTGDIVGIMTREK